MPSLEHVAWDSSIPTKPATSHPYQNSLIEDENFQPNSLTETQKLLIKRAKIQVSIILKESDERTTYDLFQRLNTGGSSLSSQELRNCILISINPPMYEWLKQLSYNENFTSCISLTDRAIEEQYDVELVLRFLIFRSINDDSLKNIGDIADFLTENMENMALSNEIDMEEEGRYFTETFELLAKTTKSNSFRRYDAAKSRFLGGFLVSAFEAVSLGIGYNLDLIHREPIDIEEKIKQLWQMQEFTGSTGSGIRASTRMPKTISLCRSLFRP